MNRSELERILREVVTGEHVASFRQASLEESLQQLRRRRSRRRAVRGFEVVSAAALLALGVWMTRSTHSTAPQLTATALPRASESPARAGTAGVEFITDDQLFALFPGRPMALIGEPGRQQFVLLGAAP